jgi:hypothetical protein
LQSQEGCGLARQSQASAYAGQQPAQGSFRHCGRLYESGEASPWLSWSGSLASSHAY